MASPRRAGDALSGARLFDRPRILSGRTDTEIAVFRATESLLGEHPFSGLSVAQIIELAGISRASFYKYFSSKLGVVAGLLIAVMDEMFEVAAPFLARPGLSLIESLRTSVGNAMEVWTAHRVLLRVVMENWASSVELEVQWTGAMNRFAEAIAGEIDHERSAGRLPAGLASERLATALVWSTERCLYIAGRSVDGDSAVNFATVDERDQVEVLVAMWAGTLLFEGQEHPAGGRPRTSRQRPKRRA